MTPLFKPTPTNDGVLASIQRALASSLFPLSKHPFADGHVLEGVSLATGVVNQVPHKMDAPLRGWFPVRIRGQAILWDDQDAAQLADTMLRLWSSAAVKVDIFVF